MNSVIELMANDSFVTIYLLFVHKYTRVRFPRKMFCLKLFHSRNVPHNTRVNRSTNTNWHTFVVLFPARHIYHHFISHSMNSTNCKSLSFMQYNIYSSRIHCVSTDCDQKSTIENDWITFSKNKKAAASVGIRLEIQIYRLVYFRKLTEKDEPPKKGNEVFKKKFQEGSLKFIQFFPIGWLYVENSGSLRSFIEIAIVKIGCFFYPSDRLEY